MEIINHYVRSFRLLDAKVKWFMLFSIFLFSIVSILDLVGLSLIFPIAKFLSGDTSFLARDEFASIRELIKGYDQQKIAAFLSVCLVVLIAVKGIFATAVMYWTSKIIMLIESRFMTRLFQHYVNAPISFHLAHNSSEFIRNLNLNIVGLYRQTAMPLVQLLSEMVLVVGIVLVLFYADPWSAVINILVLGFGGFIYSLAISKPMMRMADESHELSMQYIKTMRESLDSVSEIRVFDKINFFVGSFERIRTRLAGISYKQITIMNAPRFVLEFLISVMVMIIIFILISSGKDGEEVVTILALYAIAAMRIMPVITRLISTVNSARIAIPSVLQLSKDVELFGQEIIADVPFILSEKQKLIPGNISGFERQIEIKNVSHFFNKDNVVLDGVSLTVERGQSIGLVGHSGAGKTTLANIILGLLHPSKGEVLIDGLPMDLDEPAIRRSIGYVPQHIVMLDDTIRGNIAFGVPINEIDDEWVMRAIVRSGLDDFVRALPAGLDAKIGEKGMRLSGGQRQRIGIARALYYDPAILLLDEATSALDVETEDKISKVIQKLHREKTLIIIAHRLSTIKNCDKLFFMKDGRIESSGSFIELMQKSEDFSRLVKTASLDILDAIPNEDTDVVQ